MKGLLGRKLGMTQVFTEDGVLIPVTVVEVTPNVVLQKKTVETDGYNAVQLGFEEIKEKRTTKANIGHCKKASVFNQQTLTNPLNCDNTYHDHPQNTYDDILALNAILHF